jgi:glycerol-3-phosphate dehydrogenase
MLWNETWRNETWEKAVQTPWDIIIIGGGITGAGLLHLASGLGLRALLVEGRDFAWGTSSRSSKMVHGGLRYLREGNIKLVVESVRERQHLLKTLPGLVDPLGFLMPMYRGKKLNKLIYDAGLTFYDLIAGRKNHRFYKQPDFEMLAPYVRRENLLGGFAFQDAQTDDARLVLRVLREGVASGGSVLNYARAELLRENESVVGVTLHDTLSERTAPVRAKLVISATGAMADELRKQAGVATAKIRPLRGSHLVFSQNTLPTAQVVSFMHPQDRRAVFIYPWEGVVVVGTTDLDHPESLNAEPGITPQEIKYLLEAVGYILPALPVTQSDIISTWAGVRPVIASGDNVDPSKEARDSVVWLENGLLTVTGGKLTTFQPLAKQALAAGGELLNGLPMLEAFQPKFRQPAQISTDLSPEIQRRLSGRYGADLAALMEAAQPDELETIPGTPYLWAELRWAARAEAVAHLDDLLLRRLRLGILLPSGGQAVLPRVAEVCRTELGWDTARWHKEETRYLEICQKYYSVPLEVTAKV